MTNSYTTKIIINKPIKEVFAYTLDMTNYHQWSGSIASGYINPANRGEGAGFYEEIRFRGRVQRTDGQILRIVPNASWTFENTLAGYTIKGEYTFHSKGDEQTEITASIHLEMNNVLGMSFLIRAINELYTRAQLKRNLSDLKKLLE